MFLAADIILASLRTRKSNPCFPPHLVVAKWLANVVNCSMRCRTGWRMGCPKMVSSRRVSVVPLTYSVISVTVFVVIVMVTPFVCYKE